LHRHLIAAAEAGASIVVSSSDIPELVTLCDRVLVLHDGRVCDELVGDRVSDSEITRCFMAEKPERGQ
jgi:ribose transport system ATP-binding protein